MGTLLLWLARLSGLSGAIVVLCGGVARGSGMYFLAGVQVGSWLLGGTAMLAFASTCYIARLVEFPPGR